MKVCAISHLVDRGIPGPSVELGHGALIGRLSAAALQIDDLRISEAHAMVSLRSGGLRLLALRRRFEVGGVPVGEVELRAGLKIEFAPDLVLHVDSVFLPEAILGLRWDDGEAALMHDVASIVMEPEPAVRWRPDPDAAVHLWRLGSSWRYLMPGQPAADLTEGCQLTVGKTVFEAVWVPLEMGDATRGPQEPLKVIAFFDTVHILRDRRPPFVIAGGAARLISELVVTGAPVGWVALAQGLWGKEEPDHLLRGRLDAVLRRLRAKLASGGIREDLLSPDGLGHLELRLNTNDTTEDRT